MSDWPPKQDMHVPTVDVSALARLCHANSRRWFPSNHTTERAAVTHCTLGLAGEAGETANKVKKLYGYMDQRNAVPPDAIDGIVEELVDTMIYALVLLDMLCDDIPAAIRSKIAVCEARWGDNPVIPGLEKAPYVIVKVTCGHIITSRFEDRWQSPRFCPACGAARTSHGFDGGIQSDEVRDYIARNWETIT